MGSLPAADASLVEAVLGGDVESYGLLVERYATAAHRTAFMLGAGDETADIVQNAFLKAFSALGGFRIGEPFRPWLLAIVANETRNHRRWLLRHRTVPLALIGDETLPGHVRTRSTEEIVEERETGRALRDAVHRLPRTQREVIVCRYLLDLSEKDTAQVLNIPKGTVKSRSSRALRTLEARLGESTTLGRLVGEEVSGA